MSNETTEKFKKQKTSSLKRSGKIWQIGLVFLGLILCWWAVVLILNMPDYILPSPYDVAFALYDSRDYMFYHAMITLSEIILGFIFGILFGAMLALLLMLSPTLQKWLMPLLIISQSIPTFALAPILVLWLGFGILSKIVAAILVIFFPVTTAFFDGLKNTDIGLLELAKTMGASKYSQLVHVRLIAALPAFGSGVRVAAAIAPVGAIIGEWVGSSGGLGYVMLNANARMQIATCFAALFILSLMAMVLWHIVDFLLKKALYWVPKTDALLK